MRLLTKQPHAIHAVYCKGSSAIESGQISLGVSKVSTMRMVCIFLLSNTFSAVALNVGCSPGQQLFRTDSNSRLFSFSISWLGNTPNSAPLVNRVESRLTLHGSEEKEQS
eukprot:108427-Amphidinium_carterae.2